MTPERSSRLPEILQKHEAGLLTDWLREQQESLSRRQDLLSDRELEAQSREFLALLRAAADQGTLEDVDRSPRWAALRDMLTGISRSRSRQTISS